MATGRRPLVAGNWKMNGLRASLTELEAICRGYGELSAKIDFAICPPATLIGQAVAIAKGSGVLIGGQDCHPQASGAHTGDVSAAMLADAGAAVVIVGHSERRAGHGETDAVVRAKAEAVWRAGLIAIVCVGESKAEREAGRTIAVVDTQLSGSVPDGSTPERLVVAYEPVWAIGTGLTPTANDAGEIHAAIRAALVRRFGGGAAMTRILYGGSVKPANASDLLIQSDVDGALVGGASLKAADFLGIADAYR